MPGFEGRSKSMMKAIEKYEALPHSPAVVSKGLSIDEVIALAHVNRDVQLLIDEFATLILPELRDIHPDAGGPLTLTERQRFAQAALRHQILALPALCNQMYVRIGSEELFSSTRNSINGFFSLFKAWEIHLIADVHSFVYDVVRGARDIYIELAMVDLRLMRRFVIKDRRRTQVRGIGWSRQSATMEGLFVYLFTGPLPYELSSHRVPEEDQAKRDELYQREDARPPLPFVAASFDDVADSPPFAWVDGHRGLDCQRWGDQLCREVTNDTTPTQQKWMWMELNRWRHLRFPFWDCDHVELLKTILPEYGTGWLTAAPPPDELCREE